MEQLVLSCLESRVEENRHIYGRFLLGVFKNGDALTVATALRRSLLSQVESVAIIALDIQGVSHEFSAVAGVRESVLELTLNFQQIILRTENTLKSTQVGYLQIQGPKVVYANDLKLPKGIELVDPTQYIATVARDGLLIVKFLISTNAHNKHLRINNSQINSQQLRQVKKVLDGKNFQSQTCLQNILPLDSFISPVNRVNFTVEKDDLFNQTRERVCIEIWTNGSLHPRQALNQAVFSLVATFSAFRNVTHLDSYSFGLVSKPFKNEVFVRQTKLSTFSQLDLNKKDLSSPSKTKFLQDNKVVRVQVVKRSLTTGNLLKLLQKQSFCTTAKRSFVTSKTPEFSVLYKTNLEKMSLLSSDISNLSVSLKTYIFLKQKGINKLEHLLQHSQKKLLDLVNGNKNMYYDIKRCLLNLGLSNL